MFVLQQGGQAKSVSGEVLISDFAHFLDGHGGIADITYSAPVSPSLAGTMTITMTSGDTATVSVTNGRGITGITWSSSGTPGDGLTHTGTIAYNDGTTSTVTFQDGLKGNTGAQTYVHFAWADVQPQSDNQIYFDHVGPYIGVYSGTSSSAPSAYTSYTWYQYKGNTGDTGASIETVTLTDTTGLLDTYTITMTDGETETFTVTNGNGIDSIEVLGASTPQGGYAYAGKVVTYRINYTNGDTGTFQVYNGADGSGSVSTVSGISSLNGDVPQVISGATDPTASTSGVVNQFYWNNLTGKVFLCGGGSPGAYVWYDVAAGLAIDSALNSSSENPVQNKVITARVGTGALPNSSSSLTTAINYVNGRIPVASTATPQKDASSGAAGSSTNWSKGDHKHPLNVPSSGAPANLGTASNGSASTYARSDHVHTMPNMNNILAASTASTQTSLIDLIYPVGSIYMSVSSTDPGTLFGGTWVRIKDTFLLAAGDEFVAGTTGGEVFHTLTVNEIPSHAHEVRHYSGNGASTANSFDITQQKCTTNADTNYGPLATGGGQAHNNMPPFIAVYVWKRTI